MRAAHHYGTVPEDAESFLDRACPIVGSFGGKDGTLRGTAAKLDSALTANLEVWRFSQPLGLARTASGWRAGK